MGGMLQISPSQMPPLQNVKTDWLKINHSVWEVSVGFVKYLMYRSAYLHLTAHETNDLTPELPFNSGSIVIKQGFLLKQIGHPTLPKILNQEILWTTPESVLSVGLSVRVRD